METRYNNRQLLLKRKQLKNSAKAESEKDNFYLTDPLVKRLSKLNDEEDEENDVMGFDGGMRTIKKVKREHDSGLTVNPTEDLQKLNSICLKRFLLCKLSHHLYFAECVKDCLVKVSCQTATGKQDYKIGLIIGVTEDPKNRYFFENKAYNKFLEILVGRNDRPLIQLSNVSNKEIDEQEAFGLLSRLSGVVEFELDLNWVERKQKELNKYSNYKFTGEDFTKVRERQINNLTGNSEIALIRKKKLLEDQVNHLKTLNFREVDEKRKNTIDDLESKIFGINENLKKYSEKKESRKSDERFLEFNKVGL